MVLLNHQVKWSRLACAAFVASLLGLIGFAAFLQSIHNASPLQRVVEAIGLPLFEIGADIGLFWPSIIASVLLWTAVLYAILSMRSAKKHVPPSA